MERGQIDYAVLCFTAAVIFGGIDILLHILGVVFAEGLIGA